MLGRDHLHHRLPHQRAAFQVRAATGQADDRQVEFATVDRVLQLGTVVLLPQGHIDAGIAAVELGQEPRHQTHRRTRQASQPEASTAQPLDLLNPPSRLLGLEQDPFRVGEERLSSAGQPEAATKPLEEGRSQLALELADLLAERWLGDVETLSRPGEGARADHGYEVAELMELHEPRGKTYG